MSHAFHRYIAAQIEKDLGKRRVVVFYDPRREFEAFINELEASEPQTRLGELHRVGVGSTSTRLARYANSFLTLRLAVEPVVNQDKPEPLLVYVAGQQRDHHGSVLMELEKAGATYEPQLRRLARNELRRKYTDGDIDEMLTSDQLTYDDVARFLEQEDAEQASMLRVVFDNASNDLILVNWLASSARDEAIEEKEAREELYKLVQSRLGLQITLETPLEKARHQVQRYVLVGEFRSDLACEVPQSLAVVPGHPGKDELKRLRALVDALRMRHPDAYTAMADAVEAELRLTEEGLDPSDLGSVDTFRFEERALLSRAAELITSGSYDKAAGIVSARGRSFWVDRDVARLAQWEACRLMAELGLKLMAARQSLKKLNGSAAGWVQTYAAADGGSYEVDYAQRTLETWIARMDDEPEEACEQALGRVRKAHEDLLQEMAGGFSAALLASRWTVPDVLHQTHIFPDLVRRSGGPVAYFFIDAMRYEMGFDLVQQLGEAEDLRLQPAIAALPTITPIGMAALLPGASSSFSVVEHKGRLAPQIEGETLPTLTERMKFLRARHPESMDIDLGALLQKSTRALAKKLGDVPLLVVRSQSIDGLGEMDSGLLARHIMDTIVGNVARAIRKLAKIGIEYFVITADHGHQFSVRKDTDMMIERPGGEKVDQHRRCWAGRGGKTPAACLRVTGAELGYDTDLDFVFPKNLAVFRAGGDLAFHHGGISLQELVVPVVSLRMRGAKPEQNGKSGVAIDGYPDLITNRTFGVRIHVPADLFSKDSMPVRLVLLAEGQEVGRAGMAIDADFDRATGQVMLMPGEVVSVAMMLTRDDCQKLRIVAQDPSTDAVLAQSKDINVQLGI